MTWNRIAQVMTNNDTSVPKTYYTSELNNTSNEDSHAHIGSHLQPVHNYARLCGA
jgi:hypothetical protein